MRLCTWDVVLVALLDWSEIGDAEHIVLLHVVRKFELVCLWGHYAADFKWTGVEACQIPFLTRLHW